MSMSIGRAKVVSGCVMAALMSVAAIEVVLAQQPAEREQQVEVAEGPLGPNGASGDGAASGCAGRRACRLRAVERMRQRS